MISKNPALFGNAKSLAFLTLLVMLAACNSLSSQPVGGSLSASASVTMSPAIQAGPLPTTTDRWLSLMLVTPYPWSTPLPPYEATLLDGTYAKLDPGTPQWWNCMRCEDYIPMGGIWRLQLEKGIYRIYYEVNEWRSLGSFTLSGDRIYLFNDPHCMKVIGEYHWTIVDGALSLELIQDECAINLRAANFIKQPWLSCSPPNVEAATSGHWLEPLGCVE